MHRSAREAGNAYKDIVGSFAPVVVREASHTKACVGAAVDEWRHRIYLTIQRAALQAAGCEVIRAEKRSGTSTAGGIANRARLPPDGNVLMVTRLDRFARSIGGLQDIVRIVKTRGASLKTTEQPIDASTAAGKCFLDMLGVFAERATLLSGRCTPRLPRPGWLTYQSLPSPRHWRTGRQSRPRSFPFADEEVLMRDFRDAKAMARSVRDGLKSRGDRNHTYRGPRADREGVRPSELEHSVRQDRGS
jgi:hypothetical protein